MFLMTYMSSFTAFTIITTIDIGDEWQSNYIIQHNFN